VQIHLAFVTDQNEARRPLVDRHGVADPRKRIDRGIDALGGNTEIDVPVRTSLPSQQGVDAPAAGQARPNSRGVEDRQNPQDLRCLHDYKRTETVRTGARYGDVDGWIGIGTQLPFDARAAPQTCRDGCGPMSQPTRTKSGVIAMIRCRID
jgi:hypothetical protein